MPWLNPLIAAGGNVLGGLLAAGGALGGAAMSSATAREVNARNAALQREFAQNSIQWKVEDAKKAGIHPLYALGAQGYSAAPSYVGYDSGAGIRDASAALGAGISNATRDALKQYELQSLQDDSEMSKLKLEYQKLQNQVLKNQLNAGRGNIFDTIFGKIKLTINDILSAYNAGRGDLKVKGRPTDLSQFLTKGTPYMAAYLRGNGALGLVPQQDTIQGEASSEGLSGWIRTLFQFHDDLTSNDNEMLKRITLAARARKVICAKCLYGFRPTAFGVELFVHKPGERPYKFAWYPLDPRRAHDIIVDHDTHSIDLTISPDTLKATGGPTIPSLHD